MFRVVRLLLALSAVAAGRDSVADSDFLVRVWQKEEGLPGNTVRSLGQSSDGFLWVATAEGLARFDGTAFDELTTPGNYRGRRHGFFRVFTPRDGSVWVSSLRGGLQKVVDGALKPIIHDSEDGDTQVITRLIVHGGAPHFVRNHEVWKIEGERVRIIEAPSLELAAALAADRRREIGRGRSDNSRRPAHLIDRDGGMWLLSDSSLQYLPPGGSPPSRVTEFDGRLLVNDMLEDREGNLWIASRVQGLVRIRHRRVGRLVTRDGEYEEPVQTAIQARDGTWWVANRTGGVDRIRDRSVEHLELLPGGYARPVLCIHEDRRGRLWFATQDGTVFEWTGEGFEPRFTRTAAVSKVNAIAEDAEGSLWFGGGQGLCRWDGTDLEEFAALPLLEGCEFSSLTLDASGRLLAGTTDGRLIAFDGSGFRSLSQPNDLNRRWISAIVPIGSDEIWVATLDAGLFLRRDGLWHRFGTNDGLPEDESLTSLIFDDEDTFWLGSLEGILRTSRTELLRRVTNKELLPRWLRLDRSDGLVTRECVGGGQPGAFRDAEGTLWFPTNAGLAGVRPDRIIPNSIPPIIHFHPVEIDGVPHPTDDRPLVAGPGRVRLGFRFTGLSFSAPEKVTYRIQLVGIDPEPRLIGSSQEETYSAVPPGRYAFEVSAVNGDGVRTLRPAVLHIEVRPHFWQTGWFITSVAVAGLLFALTVGWLFARRRLQRKLQVLRVRHALQAERSRISSDLHDDLGASLTELSILSALAAEDPDDGNLRPALDELSIKAKRVVGTLDEIVWAANPTEDSLRSLVDYLAAFAREFLAAVQVPLHVEVERDIPDLSIGPRRRHNVLLATREAINNAVKHAQPESIRLKISIRDGQLVVVVQDDGRGFAVDYASSGDGLSNLRKRMTDCGGDCHIESVRGAGTTITLTLPLPPARQNP